jgi:hypothetical protein
MNAWSRAFPSAKPDAPGQPQLLDQAVLQGLVHRGAERPGQGGDRQAGHGNRSSRRPAVDPLSGCRTGYRMNGGMTVLGSNARGTKARRLAGGGRWIPLTAVAAASRGRRRLRLLVRDGVRSRELITRPGSGGTDHFDEHRKRRIADQILFVPRAARRQREHAIEQRVPSSEEPKVC